MDIEFTDPGHVTADFVGEPGQRTFYVQAVEEDETVSVLVEKQHVAGISELLTQLLAGMGSTPPTIWDINSMRLQEPVTPRWRAGAITVGLAPQLGRFVIEVSEFVPEDEDREPQRVRIWVSEEQAQLLAAHARWSVEQGRPPCRLCGLPMDREGHVCPRSNGDARAL